jgi:hypothetical protein
MKNPLLSKRTAYQHVDGFEWRKPLKRNPDSYETETFRLDKGLYLDGVQQSSLCGEVAYHKALVHPGMFAHPNPCGDHRRRGGRHATQNPKPKVCRISHDGQDQQGAGEYVLRTFAGMV